MPVGLTRHASLGECRCDKGLERLIEPAEQHVLLQTVAAVNGDHTVAGGDQFETAGVVETTAGQVQMLVVERGQSALQQVEVVIRSGNLPGDARHAALDRVAVNGDHRCA